MAGPRVRGDIRIDRNAQANRVRQGVQSFDYGASATSTLILALGSPYQTVFNSATGSAQTLRLPLVTTTAGEVGIGTEFRVTNLDASSVTVTTNEATPTTLTDLTIPGNRTAIFICTSTTDQTMAWIGIILDETSATTTLSRHSQSLTYTVDTSGAVTDTNWPVATTGSTNEFIFRIQNIGTVNNGGTPNVIIPAHGRGINPVVHVFDTARNEVIVETQIFSVAGTVDGITTNPGDVWIRVNNTAVGNNPDGRFAGTFEIYS